MPCVLRAAGKSFDADAFAASTSLPVCAVYRRGEKTLVGKSKLTAMSGVNVEVSEADFDNLTGQIRDAIKFLRKYNRELRRLRRQRGIESITLDFGIAKRNVAAQFDYFPPTLLLEAGKQAIGLEISWYHVSGG